MKSIRTLIISFTITFIALMTISPAMAKPSVNVRHLHVNNAFTSTFNNYDISTVASQVPDKITTHYRDNFSTGLILSSPELLIDDNSQVAMTFINKSNSFFTSTMAFSDKLNQFISYFTSPTKEGLAEQTKTTSESKIMRKKCNNTPSFS